TLLHVSRCGRAAACPFTSSRGEVPLSRTGHRRARARPHSFRCKRELSSLRSLIDCRSAPLCEGGLLFGGALRSGFWRPLWLCFGRGARFIIGRAAIV